VLLQEEETELQTRVAVAVAVHIAVPTSSVEIGTVAVETADRELSSFVTRFRRYPPQTLILQMTLVR
jgi:hypothetical protein